MGIVKEKQLAVLKSVVHSIMWMASRYAHNRNTYAPSQFNCAVMSLDEVGLSHLWEGTTHVEYIETGLRTTDHQRYVNDGMFGKWNPETRRFVKE